MACLSMLRAKHQGLTGSGWGPFIDYLGIFAMKLTAALLTALLANHAVAGGFDSQHEVSVLASVLSRPIPQDWVTRARERDDQIMLNGELDGQRLYLVTDERVDQLEDIVETLLINMDEDPHRWIVRVFDTEPKMENAFVTGGKYIYVFTGFLESAQSEDEIAFVLSHELGHSLLQHQERRANDWTQQLAQLATIAAALNGSDSLETLSTVLQSDYSQIDEQEADAIGVAIATRAGYNALRGADFFVRDVREQEAEKQVLAQYHEQVEQMRVDLLQQHANCTYIQKNWDSVPHNEKNVTLYNEECGTYNAKRQVYAQHQAQYDAAIAQRNIAQLTSSHPDSQRRIAAIAALTDYMRGNRSLDTISGHQQAHRVMTALKQIDSVLVANAGDAYRDSSVRLRQSNTTERE